MTTGRMMSTSTGRYRRGVGDGRRSDLETGRVVDSTVVSSGSSSLPACSGMARGSPLGGLWITVSGGAVVAEAVVGGAVVGGAVLGGASGPSRRAVDTGAW